MSLEQFLTMASLTIALTACSEHPPEIITPELKSKAEADVIDGFKLAASNNFKEAKSAFDRAALVLQDNPVVLNNSGVAAAALGDTRAAEVLLRRAINNVAANQIRPVVFVYATPGHSSILLTFVQDSRLAVYEHEASAIVQDKQYYFVPAGQGVLLRSKIDSTSSPPDLKGVIEQNLSSVSAKK